MFYLLVIFGLALVGMILYSSYVQNKGLPPGPPRLPLIGNIHQLPQENPWRTYQKWSKQYGPIFSLRVGMDTIIMLGTHTAARDLLDKRRNI